MKLPALLLAFSLAAGLVPFSSGQDAAAQAPVASEAPLEVEVVQTDADGIPTYLRGRLGAAGPPAADIASAEAALRPAMRLALHSFHLTPSELDLRRVTTDLPGNRHYHYQQILDGLDVIGGELIVHVDAVGEIFAINGTARGGSPAPLRQPLSPIAALSRSAGGMRCTGLRKSVLGQAYIIAPEGTIRRVYEAIVAGDCAGEPVRDALYVGVDTGEIVAIHPQISFLKDRRIYSANNGTSLPGTFRRAEGQAPTADAAVNATYDAIGDTYDAYMSFWNRDSYDDAGAALSASVHYSTNYCNMFWNGTQLVYGDGFPSQGCNSPAGVVDLTAHELTHAITERESDLVYSGESGGLNEAMSDIFGAFTEAWVDGGRTGSLAVSADTWKIGEDYLPPAWRYMNDPQLDGASADYWTPLVGNLDVHYSSGIANLAFYLMSEGGEHPRGASTVHVDGIGMEKAIRIFYELNVNLLTPNATFHMARNASLQAAQSLGFTPQERISVRNAWAAVGVGNPFVAAPVPTLGNANWLLGSCLLATALLMLARRAPRTR